MAASKKLLSKKPARAAEAARVRLPATPPLRTASDPGLSPGTLSVVIARQALTMEEAAQVAGVTRIVIRKEIARGRIAAFRVGYRRIRIPVNVLNAYIRARMAEGV